MAKIIRTKTKAIDARMQERAWEFWSEAQGLGMVIQ